MVQRRGILVFVLCTAFVIGFYAVISYEAAGVQLTTLQSKGPATPCVSGSLCNGFSITFVSLRTANFTDELGPVGYSNLTLKVAVMENYTVAGLEIYIGGTRIGEIAGPLGPGLSKTITFTLPSTDAIVQNGSYVVSVGGVVSEPNSDAVKVWKTATTIAT